MPKYTRVELARPGINGRIVCDAFNSFAILRVPNATLIEMEGERAVALAKPALGSLKKPRRMNIVARFMALLVGVRVIETRTEVKTKEDRRVRRVRRGLNLPVAPTLTFSAGLKSATCGGSGSTWAAGSSVGTALPMTCLAERDLARGVVSRVTAWRSRRRRVGLRATRAASPEEVALHARQLLNGEGISRSGNSAGKGTETARMNSSAPREKLSKFYAGIL